MRFWVWLWGWIKRWNTLGNEKTSLVDRGHRDGSKYTIFLISHKLQTTQYILLLLFSKISIILLPKRLWQICVNKNCTYFFKRTPFILSFLNPLGYLGRELTAKLSCVLIISTHALSLLTCWIIFGLFMHLDNWLKSLCFKFSIPNYKNIATFLDIENSWFTFVILKNAPVYLHILFSI